MGRIVTAEFDSGSRYAQIKNTIWQYDYGVTLRMTGLDLPAAVEVHFASVPSGGESETRIGVTQDGVTEVKIPNALLALHKTEDYRLYAFVYLTDADSGRTEYRAYMTVKARPKPGEQHPDTDEDHPLSDAVREVSAAADRAESAAGASADSAETARAEAESAGKDAEAAQKAAEQTAEDAKQTATDRQAAGEYAELAKQVATKNGFCQLKIDDTGHLILNRTDNIVDLLDFALTKNGHLEVIAHED